MTNEALKSAFNEVIGKAAASGFDVSKIEVAREWFTNDEFKRNLSDFVFAKSQEAHQ